LGDECRELKALWSSIKKIKWVRLRHPQTK
jgi:hypothetical protein